MYICLVKMRNLLFIAFILLLIGSCENEIDINAPYKEVPYVYGLLEAQTDVQYIRIEKAYQNSVNQTVQQGAQYADSLYFDTLIVTVRNLNNANEPVHYFYKTYEFAKDKGFFTSAKHHVYKSTNFKPDPYGRYELKIFNPKSGQTYISTTGIVEPMTVDTTRFIFMKPYLSVSYPVMKISTIGNGTAIHDAFLRFYYTERNIASGTTDTTFIDFYLEKNVTVDYQFYKGRQIFISPLAFYSFLKTNIRNKPGVERRFLKMERHSVGGSAFLKDVIELSQDNGGFIDKKRDYSNLTNGAQGIFSSRAQSVRTVNVSTAPNNLQADSFPIYLKEFPLGVPNVPQFVYP